MTSRLLSSLEARIARTRDPLENTCLRAEKAALLARHGHIDEARTELAIVHGRYDKRPNAVVSAWANLAEGLVIYYCNLGSHARDKLRRSLALSEAIAEKQLTALSAAWLAQMDFSVLDLVPMARNISLALRTSDPDQHSARSRACTVVASAFHWAERLDLALPWYNRAHHHATVEGDEATVSAIMHNMAWFRAAAARRLSICGVMDMNQARQAQLGADSTGRFDGMIGIAALGSLVPILQAQVLMLHSNYGEALKLFEAHAKSSASEGLERMACMLLADIAWCKLNTGDLAGARIAADAAQKSILSETQLDDLAMTHSLLARLYSAIGEPEFASDHNLRASTHWEKHFLQQKELVSTLPKVLEDM